MGKTETNPNRNTNDEKDIPSTKQKPNYQENIQEKVWCNLRNKNSLYSHSTFMYSNVWYL